MKVEKLRKRRRLPSPSLVIACLALAVALSGVGYAASVLPANSVGSRELKDGQVKRPDLANKSVNAAKVVPVAFTDVGLPDAFPSCDDVGPGWQDVSPNVNNPVAYARDVQGFVHLRGVAIRCGAATDTIFTLPAGYRPAKQEVIGALTSTSGVTFLGINPSGAVNSSLGVDSWLSLDSVTFRCAPSGSNGCP